MNDILSHLSKVAIAIAGCGVSTLTVANTQNVDINSGVTNHYGKTITLIDQTTPKYAPQNSLALANGVTAQIPLGQWTGQTDPKNTYFTVNYIDPITHKITPLCQNLQQPYKHPAGLTLVEKDGDCIHSSTPVPPSPVDNNPVIEGFQPNQTLTTGALYHAEGTVSNPDGMPGAPEVSVVKSDHADWLTITPEQHGNHYTVTATGVAPSEPGLYDFTIYAHNAKGGENTYKVDITVQKPNTPPKP